MRLLLLTIMVALPALAAVILLVLSTTWHRFQQNVPELGTTDDIHQLRSLAKLQMYLSLLGHPLLTIGGVVMAWLVGWLILKNLGWVDLLLYGVLPITILFVIATTGESPARMAKSIPVRNGSLASERDHIVDVWINRLFPDW
jgi:hypothetical protein